MNPVAVLRHSVNKAGNYVWARRTDYKGGTS